MLRYSEDFCPACISHSTLPSQSNSQHVLVQGRRKRIMYLIGKKMGTLISVTVPGLMKITKNAIKTTEKKFA